MTLENTQFLTSTSSPCEYYQDGRMASFDFYGYEQPKTYPFQKPVLQSVRQNRFSLQRKGLIGNAFSAITNSCDDCNACVPLRINTTKFKESTRNKKVLKDFFEGASAEAFWFDSEDVIGVMPALFDLYKKFLSARFPNSSMHKHDIEDLAITVLSKTNTLILMNAQQEIIGFSQVDREAGEASLDYIAYNPDDSDLRLGNVSFLSTVRWAQENFIPYIYIGATNESAPLKYKRYYSGLETFDGENWVDYDPKVHLEGPDYDEIIMQLPPQRQKAIRNHPNVS